MIRHLLIDLDDTLLVNNMDTFAPAYYKALSTYMSNFVPPQKLLSELMQGTLAMLKNTDPDSTLEQIFDAVFYPGLGIEKSSLIDALNRFYDEEFPKLQPLTQPINDAIELVRSAIQRGLNVTVATNPLFPKKAILERLRWAKLPPEEICFSHIPSYETSHYAKPNPNYFLELLTILGASKEECIMIGNDLQADILPALECGIQAFHLAPTTAGTYEKLDGYYKGSLSSVLSLINIESL